MSTLARRQISLTMWRWTADGVDKNGIVRQDALKYNTERQVASYSAIEARRNGSGGLRHEHIIPRARLTREIITRNLHGEALHKFLSDFCRSAIITVTQDLKLQPRADMPKGWNCEGGNIYQRYIDAKLFDKLKMPTRLIGPT